MKRRNLILVLSAFALIFVPILLAANPFAKNVGSVPSLAEVEDMSGEEARDALAGYRRKDILETWGTPREVHTALSNTLIDNYDAEARGGWIAVYYDTSMFPGPVDPASPDAETLPVKQIKLQTIE